MVINDYKVEEIIEAIKSCLSRDLLKVEYVEENKENPMYGHCYIATETLYHMFVDNEPLRREVLYVYHGKDEFGNTHWWLQDIFGQIHDVTSEQYTSKGRKPPYKAGRRGYFLTREPSKRSRILIQRVKNYLSTKEIIGGDK